jgi:O-antigen/teichoic acid export membrane protein
MLNFFINKTKKIRKVSKEGFWILFGQLMLVLGSFYGIRLITELLSPSDYGQLAIGMTISTMTGQIIFGPIGNGISRFYAPANEKKDLKNYLKASESLIYSATTFVMFLIFSALLMLASIGYFKWISLVFFSFIFSLLSGYSSIISSIQNSARHRLIVSICQGADTWAKFSIAAGLMYVFGKSSLITLIGYIISSFFIVSIQYLYLIKKIFNQKTKKIVSINNQKSTKKNIWRTKILNYSFPFAIWGIFTWLQSSSDRWAIGYFLSAHEVGLYSAVFQLGFYPILMINSMASQLLTPILFQKAGDGTDTGRNRETYKLILNLTIIVLVFTFFAFTFASFFHSEIFKLFVSKHYTSASYLLPWIILSGGIFAAGQNISLNLMTNLKPHLMIDVKIFTAILGTILNFLGAYLFGLNGIAGAGIIFSSVYFCWILFVVSNEKNMSMKLFS